MVSRHYETTVAEPVSMRSKLTNLLVEDDEELSGLLEHKLARAGYKILRARDGMEALRIYDPQKVDLVLTDLIMPDLEGIELIIRLKRLHPNPKIIAMSGGGRNGAEGYLAIARRLGVTDTLAKPFTCEELVCIVRKAFATQTINPNDVGQKG